MTHFADRLYAAIEKTGAPTCVGIDPYLDRIPSAFFSRAKESEPDPKLQLLEAVRLFCSELVEVLAETGITVVKPQVAFFEALGPRGLLVYEEVCAASRDAGMVVIGDVKRGDIGSTSAAYSRAWLEGSDAHGLSSDPFSVDSITINPYFGSDGVKPFVDGAVASGRGLFILLKTSNPSSSELQDQELSDGKLVHEIVAERIREWGQASISEESGFSAVGAVVGATHPETAASLREKLPNTILLVPGFGAQGAGVNDLEPFFDSKGQGAIVNSSRGVIHAYGKSDFDGDWKSAVSESAKTFISELSALTKQRL